MDKDKRAGVGGNVDSAGRNGLDSNDVLAVWLHAVLLDITATEQRRARAFGGAVDAAQMNLAKARLHTAIAYNHLKIFEALQ